MTERRVRILLARLGEGYEVATMKLARVFSEAGFEVIYTELQEPRAIVFSAIQESVDHIGITILPGADIESLRKLFELLAGEGAANIRVTVGGFVEDRDIAKLKAMGVVELFPKGTSYDELIEWSRAHIKSVEEV